MLIILRLIRKSISNFLLHSEIQRRANTVPAINNVDMEDKAMPNIPES